MEPLSTIIAAVVGPISFVLGYFAQYYINLRNLEHKAKVEHLFWCRDRGYKYIEDLAISLLHWSSESWDTDTEDGCKRHDDAIEKATILTFKISLYLDQADSDELYTKVNKFITTKFDASQFKYPQKQAKAYPNVEKIRRDIFTFLQNILRGSSKIE